MWLCNFFSVHKIVQISEDTAHVNAGISYSSYPLLTKRAEKRRELRVTTHRSGRREKEWQEINVHEAAQKDTPRRAKTDSKEPRWKERRKKSKQDRDATCAYFPICCLSHFAKRGGKRKRDKVLFHCVSQDTVLRCPLSYANRKLHNFRILACS